MQKYHGYKWYISRYIPLLFLISLQAVSLTSIFGLKSSWTLFLIKTSSLSIFSRRRWTSISSKGSFLISSLVLQSSVPLWSRLRIEILMRYSTSKTTPCSWIRWFWYLGPGLNMYRSRFFCARYLFTYLFSENHRFLTKSGHRQTYQNFQKSSQIYIAKFWFSKSFFSIKKHWNLTEFFFCEEY